MQSRNPSGPTMSVFVSQTTTQKALTVKESFTNKS